MGTRFDRPARKAIDFAMIEVERRGNRALDPAHLLLGLLQATTGAIPEALRRAGVEVESLRASVSATLATSEPAQGDDIEVARATEQILQRSSELSLARGAAIVSDLDILIATAELADSPAGRALGAHAVTAASLAAAAQERSSGPAAGSRDVPDDSAGSRAATMRSGIGYDSHRFGVGGPLVLGGVRIDADVHLAGHSDGDAIAHALTDAVLGAAAAGDIGEMFADTDPANRGRDSIGMLRDAVERVRQLGWSVANVDVVVVAETPRIGPHREAMRSALAPALGIPADCVAIKGKTNEGMGWIGRGEGIACMAIATLTGRGSA